MPRQKTQEHDHEHVCPHCGGDLPSREVYVPIEGFIADIDGHQQVLNPGFRFREGHPVVKKYPHLMRKIRVQYDVEER